METGGGLPLAPRLLGFQVDTQVHFLVQAFVCFCVELVPFAAQGPQPRI